MTKTIQELSLRAMIAALLLTVILAASSTYLALKVGILPSASIPAAIASMSILRLFKGATIFENNLVQTAASAGEAVAGGVAYTLPALVIIRYWGHFYYWETVAIILCGSVLGILGSIPLRRVLMTIPQLSFPEGRAIAAILQAHAKQSLGMCQLLYGVLAGSLLEFVQTGLNIIPQMAQRWWSLGHTIFGFAIGFSTSLIGVGYLIGFRVGLSLFLGALLAWGIGLPLVSGVFSLPLVGHDPIHAALLVYGEKIRYLGLGALLTASLWSLLTLLPAFYQNVRFFWRRWSSTMIAKTSLTVPRTERDIPLRYVITGISLDLVIIYSLFAYLFPLADFGLASYFSVPFLIGMTTYVLLIGLISIAICSYFSGLVGVTATPGSAVIIAGVMLVALILRVILTSPLIHSVQLQSAAAITIIIGAVVAGAACIANDNIQDLKVGHLIEATPWKQQVMLLLGTFAAALVIPYVMEVLFSTYGIAQVLAHPGMNPAYTLAAPPAVMMANVAQGVFYHDLPWEMLGAGFVLVSILIVLNYTFFGKCQRLSMVGVAMGIYLPLSASLPLVIGSLFASFSRCLEPCDSSPVKASLESATHPPYRPLVALLACGLVTGATLMDVLLAIFQSWTGHLAVLVDTGLSGSGWDIALGFISVIGLGLWFYRALNKPLD